MNDTESGNTSIFKRIIHSEKIGLLVALMVVVIVFSSPGITSSTF